MTSSTRILNRALLLIVGVVALFGALVAARPLLPERLTAPWWQSAQRVIGDALAAVRTWRLPWEPADGARIAVAGAGVLAAVALIVFLATRRKPRTHTVLRFADATGSTSVDEAVADAVLADTLRQRNDVLSSHTRGYRLAGRTALRVSIVPRAAADLPALLADAQHAVARWHALSGSGTPVVVHLADRSGFDRLRSASRTR